VTGGHYTVQSYTKCYLSVQIEEEEGGGHTKRIRKMHRVLCWRDLKERDHVKDRMGRELD